MFNFLSKFFNQNATINKKGSESLPVTAKEFNNLLQHLNLTAVPVEGSKNSDKVAIMPVGANSGVDNRPIGFCEYWLENAWNKNEAEVEQFREERYEYYRFMDTNSTEASLTLDTYADECVSAAILGDSPIKIDITGDNKAKAKVFSILAENDFLSFDKKDLATNHRAHIRDLAKFGDFMVRYTRSGNKSSEGIHIQKINHQMHEVKVVRDPSTSKHVAYAIGKDVDLLPPWEITHGKIKDSTFDPYGRSILEPIRSAYQQLLITEALLALSRASKVERLIIKVPSISSNPTTAFQNLLQMKSSLKSIIFGDNNSSRSKSRIPALTDILFMPSGEGYEIDRLQSSIDVSDIDDVEFFRDKFLTGTRLPKSYFLADDDTRWIEGEALVQQDLKFARALLPLQDSYVELLTNISTVLLILLGYDLNKVKVNVSMARPQILDTSIVEKVNDSLEMIGGIVENINDNVQLNGEEYKMSMDGWLSMLSRMSGLSPEIVSLIKKSGKTKGLKEGEIDGEDIQDILKEKMSMTIENNSEKIVNSWGYTLQEISENQKTAIKG